MQIIKQQTPLTKTELFINQINSLYSMLKSNHTMLMGLWNKSEDDVLEILTGLGTSAESVFNASATIQGLLKTFDNNYEVIYPYKWKMINDVKTKVMLNVTFKQDGSLDTLTEIE